MDFKQMLRGREQAAPTEPRELWASLDRQPGYGYMRDVQAQVLTAWHARRGDRDLVVKVNTGGGKTIDGLLILQSYINAGEGPGLYVAPNKYLVEQVCREAANLGIAVVTDPDDPRYLASEAIAVVTVAKLVNGRSVFAAARPNRAPAPIGSVVIDDAHAALATTREHLSITVKRNSGTLFDDLLALFDGDLDTQSPGALLEVKSQAYGVVARVPFWAWREKVTRARQLLHAHQTSDRSLGYALPALDEVLHLCRAVFTGTEVTVTPPCTPIRHITGFTEAKHRVYLTATLADDGVLVSDFGADPTSIEHPITPLTAGDIGERMILAPQDINPAVILDDARTEIARLAATYNVVVLVPSARAAQAWSDHAADVIWAADVDVAVTRLRAGHVGLMVTINKYDGIDLPNDACRVLVIDGLPEYSHGEERVESKLLRQVGADDRQVQRIEQGMGRGVRSNEDHCVVFLLGSRLSQLVADPRSFERFSAATRAQLKLSREVAKNLEGAGIADIIGVARQALTRDHSWVTLARQALVGIAAPTGSVSPMAVARRQAFEIACDGDNVAAAQLLSHAANGTTDRGQGWLLEQKAAYEDQYSPVAAQQTLLAARRKNPSVLRPLSGLTYQRIQTSADQAQQAADFLAGRYASAHELRIGIQAVADELSFDPERTEEAEEACRVPGSVEALN
jgi:replicative superfamily II helicase